MKAGGFSKPLLLVTFTFGLSIFYMLVGAVYYFFIEVGEKGNAAQVLPDQVGSISNYGFGFLLLFYLMKSVGQITPFIQHWQQFEVRNPWTNEHLLLNCILTAVFISISAVIDYTLHFIWHFESSDSVHGQVLDWNDFLIKKCETKTLVQKCNIYHGIFTLFVDLIVFFVMNISCILVSINANALFKRYVLKVCIVLTWIFVLKTFAILRNFPFSVT